MTETTRNALACVIAILVLILTIWVYWPGRTGPVLLDDLSSVMVIGDLQAQPELAWDYITGDKSGPLGRPISIASFVLEKLVFGNNLEVSKCVNIALHLFNGALVIWLFWLLFGYRAVPGYRWLAVVLGAGWLLSPLFVSTVLYLVQRMAMLSATFMLFACIAYVYWRVRPGRDPVSAVYLLLGGASILLAIFSKENAVVVIPVLLLIETLWFQFAARDGQTITWLRSSCLWMIGLGAAALLLIFTLGYEGREASFSHRYFTQGERLLTQGRILWDYVAQLYLPDVQRMGLYHDDVVVSTSLFQPLSTLYALLAWLGVVTLFSVLLMTRQGRYLALGIAWFIVAHSVESTVLPLELYFEHRNYFPTVGLFLLLGSFYALAVQRWPQVSNPLLVYFACYVLWLASLTGSQVQVWSSHPLLILNHLNAHPESFRANSDMAVQLANQGEYAAAQKYSARAFAVSNGERSGDHDIRDLALACIANQPVASTRIEGLGTDNPERPFGSVVTLQTMVRLLQDDACPSFNRLQFANRMTEIFLHAETPASASENIFLGLALLENALQRWQKAEAYIDRFLQSSPDNAQGLLMKLHFVTALGKVDAADAVKFQLGQLQDQGKLTVGEQQTLSLYLEN